MWNNKYNKGVSLVEAMVAIFILGVIAAIVLNSSSMFIRSQQTLISHDRKDQMADLILQDIMEYTKFQNNLYGTITADSQLLGGDTIVISGVDVAPQPGDLFLVDGVPGRYIVESFSQSGLSGTITSKTDFPLVSTSSGTALTFIAFKKQNLNCFNDLNLSVAVPATCPDESPMPSEVIALFNHWNSEIDNELGTQITTRQIEVTADSLVKVTLGEGTNDTVLARKINNCIFQEEPSSVAFTFPGRANPVITGIMQGTENPVAHYFASGKAQHFPNSFNEDLPLENTTVSCIRTGASTCRQTYAGSNTISVFLYQYTGTVPIHVYPTSCNESTDWQCSGVVINPQDLSLWFIFDEYNHWDDSKDTTHIGTILPDWNQGGYLLYKIKSLPNTARILVFDDNSESCQGDIVAGECTGQYKWRNAHDGLVVHLATPNITSLSDIQLEIREIPFGIKSWRVLKPTAACLIASDTIGSAHGTARDIEPTVDQDSSCWTEVNAEETNLTVQLNAGNTTSMTVTDSSIFPADGQVQVGNELINYESNNTVTNTLSTLVRGIREEAELGEIIGASGGPDDETWQDQVLDTSDSYDDQEVILKDLGDPEIGFHGGFLEIDGEIFKADYNNDFDNRENNNIHFTARAQLGTAATAHAVDARVANFDMRDQTWMIGTPVYEGPLNSIAVVEAEFDDSPHDDNNNATFPRVRIKDKVTLNLSSAQVCE